MFSKVISTFFPAFSHYAESYVLGVYTRTHMGTCMSTTMTVRREKEVKQRLDDLADVTQRSKSFLAAEAIREYLENNEWQIREIK